MMTAEPASDCAAIVRPNFAQRRSFAETAASMRRAFDELRAAEDALEQQIADIHAQMQACGMSNRASKACAA